MLGEAAGHSHSDAPSRIIIRPTEWGLRLPCLLFLGLTSTLVESFDQQNGAYVYPAYYFCMLWLYIDSGVKSTNRGPFGIDHSEYRKDLMFTVRGKMRGNAKRRHKFMNPMEEFDLFLICQKNESQTGPSDTQRNG